MHIEIFKLKFVNVKNNFLHFSPSSFNNLVVSSVHALKVNTQESLPFYFSPYPSPYGGTLSDDCVGISSSYARALGLQEDQHLVVSTINNLGSIRRLHVSPLTTDDLEIVYSSSAAIEAQLLSQLRIVWPNQVFCAWVSSNICINLTVDTLSPELQYGRLEEYTEIVVNVVPTQKAGGSQDSKLPAYLRENNYCSQDELDFTVHCRGIPIDETIREHFELGIVPPSAIYILKSSSAAPALVPGSVWKLKKAYEGETEEISVQLFVVNGGEPRCPIWTEVFLSENVASRMNIEIGTKLTLYPEDAAPREAIRGVLISPRFQFTHDPKNEARLVEEVKSALQDFTSAHKSVLLNNKGEVTLRSGNKVQLTLRPLSIAWGSLSNSSLGDVAFSVNEFKSGSDSTNSIASPSPDEVTIWEHLLDRDQLCMLDKLSSTESRQANSRANVLLTGRSGSGKTRLCEALMKRVSRSPYFFHNASIDCSTMKGKRIEVIVRELSELLKKAVNHQPSVILLENVDTIASLPKADAAGTEASLYTNRVANKIAAVLVECQRLNRISFVGTAASSNNVHGKIYSVIGRSLFTSTVAIPDHSKAERMEILGQLIVAKAPGSVLEEQELDHLATQTEGFMIADLDKLVRTAHFEAWQREINRGSDLRITTSDLTVAVECTKPSHLAGIELFKETKYSWSAIGGLSEAKDRIIEVIIWPTMYPHIMSQCPLKPQTGILVYGAPGTGKTILARAAAYESSLNFITVKGPELMSKYIGMSEEGVRNVFEKARVAKPCLLFFDEFESLAPRRGQDQTGVTDRVVNQLLTALDGVEPLNGVYVMAASSRPDLIDPALLRPGRIGTSVFCPFPDPAAREEILATLSESVRLDEDVCLAEIAEVTEGFSGADLKGLLTTAQLKVVDNIVSELSLNEDELQERLPSLVEKQNCIKLTQKDFLDALEHCKPSLSPADKRNFDRIYDEFRKPSAVRMSEQKVTLA